MLCKEIMKVKFRSIIASKGFDIGIEMSLDHSNESRNNRGNFRFCNDMTNPSKSTIIINYCNKVSLSIIRRDFIRSPDVTMYNFKAR